MIQCSTIINIKKYVYTINFTYYLFNSKGIITEMNNLIYVYIKCCESLNFSLLTIIYFYFEWPKLFAE